MILNTNNLLYNPLLRGLAQKSPLSFCITTQNARTGLLCFIEATLTPVSHLDMTLIVMTGTIMYVK